MVCLRFSYQLASKTDGLELLHHAAESGVGNLPTVLAQADLWTLEDRSREVALRKKRVARAKVAEVERELSAQRDEDGSLKYEDRVLCATVYPDYGSISDLFVEHYELIPIMVDQLMDRKCHHRVHKPRLLMCRDPRSARPLG